MAINLKFFGDFYIDSSQTTESISDRLYPVLQTINDEDLIILNLESPLGKSESPRSDKSSLLSIDDGEIDFKNLFKKVLVNLGNNHITDYGIEGIDKTIKKLESNKIPFVGVGHNLEAASRPFIYSDDDLNIGFFSSTSSNPEVSSIIAGEGYGCVSYDTNFDLISKQLLEYDDLDYKVMLVHWGHEYSYIQSLDQRKFGRKFIDLGFDLVIGTHPHIIQGVESYKNGTIVYSLGNFIFDSFRKKNTFLEFTFPPISNISLSVSVDPKNNYVVPIPLQYKARRVFPVFNCEKKVNRFIYSLPFLKYSSTSWEIFTNNKKRLIKKYVVNSNILQINSKINKYGYFHFPEIGDGVKSRYPLLFYKIHYFVKHFWITIS